MVQRKEIIKMISKQIWYGFLKKNVSDKSSINVDIEINESVFKSAEKYVMEREPETIEEIFDYSFEFYEKNGFILDMSSCLEKNKKLKKEISRIKECGFDFYFYTNENSRNKQDIHIALLETSFLWSEKQTLTCINKINKIYSKGPTEIEWIFSDKGKKQLLILKSKEVVHEEFCRIREEHCDFLNQAISSLYCNLEEVINIVKMKYNLNYIFEKENGSVHIL